MSHLRDTVITKASVAYKRHSTKASVTCKRHMHRYARDVCTAMHAARIVHQNTMSYLLFFSPAHRHVCLL